MKSLTLHPVDRVEDVVTTKYSRRGQKVGKGAKAMLFKRLSIPFDFDRDRSCITLYDHKVNFVSLFVFTIKDIASLSERGDFVEEKLHPE